MARSPRNKAAKKRVMPVFDAKKWCELIEEHKKPLEILEQYVQCKKKLIHSFQTWIISLRDFHKKHNASTIIEQEDT